MLNRRIMYKLIAAVIVLVARADGNQNHFDFLNEKQGKQTSILVEN